MSKKQKDPQQIYRADGKECFVEVTNGMLKDGKVILNFCKYNANNGNKMDYNIQIFMDVPAFLVFAKKVEFGQIAKDARNEKALAASEGRYAKAVWQSKPGGTGVAALKAQNRTRPDGMAEARQLEIVPGLKSDLAFRVLSGPGEEQGKGLIVPNFDYSKDSKTTKQILLPISNETLQELCLITTMHIQSMITAGWMNGSYEYKKESKVVEMPTSQTPTSSASTPLPMASGYYNDMPR